MKLVESLLRSRIGLDAASIGAGSLERTLRSRMNALSLTDSSEYIAHLSADPAEWEELLEAVVVTETWFFRDQTPFQVFAQLFGLRARVRPGEIIRVLSLPCSTGEEPYSLAMALLDAGVARERFVIDGMDISTRALGRARLGLYGKNSFRGRALGFRDRHFTPTEGGFRLKPEVSDSVNFELANVLDAKLFATRPAYDFIFCRNLLIYFDRVTQAQVLAQLRGSLSPRGVLFLGPAELPLALNHGYTPLGIPMSFACRKSEVIPKSAGFQPSLKDGIEVWRKTISTPSSVATATPQAAGAQVASKPANHSDPLATARAFADAGRLSEATACCQAHLKSAGPSAEAFYLLGLIHDADGDASALGYYRKALYLEPNHYESLLQLALLLERRGDALAAQTFKRRAERILQKV